MASLSALPLGSSNTSPYNHKIGLTDDGWQPPGIIPQTVAAAAAEDPMPFVGGGYYPTEG